GRSERPRRGTKRVRSGARAAAGPHLGRPPPPPPAPRPRRARAAPARGCRMLVGARLQRRRRQLQQQQQPRRRQPLLWPMNADPPPPPPWLWMVPGSARLLGLGAGVLPPPVLLASAQPLTAPPLPGLPGCWPAPGEPLLPLLPLPSAPDHAAAAAAAAAHHPALSGQVKRPRPASASAPLVPSPSRPLWPARRAPAVAVLRAGASAQPGRPASEAKFTLRRPVLPLGGLGRVWAGPWPSAALRAPPESGVGARTSLARVAVQREVLKWPPEPACGRGPGLTHLPELTTFTRCSPSRPGLRLQAAPCVVLGLQLVLGWGDGLARRGHCSHGQWRKAEKALAIFHTCGCQSTSRGKRREDRLSGGDPASPRVPWVASRSARTRRNTAQMGEQRRLLPSSRHAAGRARSGHLLMALCSEWLLGGHSPPIGLSPSCTVELVPIFPHVCPAALPRPVGKGWIDKRTPDCKLFLNNSFALDSTWIYPEDSRWLHGHDRPRLLTSQVAVALCRPAPASRPLPAVAAVAPQPVPGACPGGPNIAFAAAAVVSVDPQGPPGPPGVQPCHVLAWAPLKAPRRPGLLSGRSREPGRAPRPPALLLHPERASPAGDPGDQEPPGLLVSSEDGAAKGSRPVASTPVPGCVVWTGDDRVFFFNPTMQLSVWEKPGDLRSHGDLERILGDPPHKRKLQAAAAEMDGGGPGSRTPPRTLLPLEQRAAHFRDMLLQRGVSAFSTWGKELHKIVFDPRYLLLNSEERRQIFEQFVKTRAKEESREKRSKLLLAREGFRRLLEESKVSPRGGRLLPPTECQSSWAPLEPRVARRAGAASPPARLPNLGCARRPRARLPNLGCARRPRAPAAQLRPWSSRPRLLAAAPGPSRGAGHAVHGAPLGPLGLATARPRGCPAPQVPGRVSLRQAGSQGDGRGARRTRSSLGSASRPRAWTSRGFRAGFRPVLLYRGGVRTEPHTVFTRAPCAALVAASRSPHLRGPGPRACGRSSSGRCPARGPAGQPWAPVLGCPPGPCAALPAGPAWPGPAPLVPLSEAPWPQHSRGWERGRSTPAAGADVGGQRGRRSRRARASSGRRGVAGLRPSGRGQVSREPCWVVGCDGAGAGVWGSRAPPSGGSRWQGGSQPGQQPWGQGSAGSTCTERSPGP
ncbi:LOW QUALITY PROTEIN: Transcription elongation regulator 1-like protein, partial [Galemys pyrenaicus]